LAKVLLLTPHPSLTKLLLLLIARKENVRRKRRSQRTTRKVNKRRLPPLSLLRKDLG